MGANGTNRLERFLATEAGARFLADAETEAAAKEAAIEERRRLAADREELLRRKRERLPALDQRVEEADAEHERAREAERAAHRRECEARTAASSEHRYIYDGMRRIEAALTRTADPRLLAGIEEASEALRTWPDTRSRLRRFRRETATNWDGTETWTKRAGNNDAGLDALQAAIEGARKALERLALVPEPTEEAIAAGLAAVKDAVAATLGEPPPLVMVDYDPQGRPKAK
jgi:hypothetical protein